MGNNPRRQVILHGPMRSACCDHEARRQRKGRAFQRIQASHAYRPSGRYPYLSSRKVSRCWIRESRFAPRSLKRLKTPKANTPSEANALTHSEIAPTLLSGFQQGNFLRLRFSFFAVGIAGVAVAGHDFFDHRIAPVNKGVGHGSDTSGEMGGHERAYRFCDELLAMP
jgi:hypothetical protein